MVKRSKLEKQFLESFDYDYFESRVNQVHDFAYTEKLISDLDFGRWIMTFIIGVTTALVALFIEKFTDIFSEYRSYVLHTGIFMENNSKINFGGAFALYSIVSCGFILVAAYCVAILCPVAGGSGIP